jgi:hypothetical protein
MPIHFNIMNISKNCYYKSFLFLVSFLVAFPFYSKAQIGDYRNNIAIGVNGGYMMTNVGFSPKVTQKLKSGISGGLSFRYTSEKYFKTLCSLYAELNFSQMGWSEDIVTLKSEPVINEVTGLAEKYDRRMSYIQMPVMAHLSWGKEINGFAFFFQAGPQFGYMLSESTSANFTMDNANITDRANQTTAQYSMPVEKKLDYGITAGMGVEYSHSKVGHFLLEGRYYYGLGNIYGASKRDYFGKSNQSAIEIKLSYLFDVKKNTN